MSVDEAISALEIYKAQFGGVSELCQCKTGFLYEVLEIGATGPEKVALIVIDDVPGRYVG